MVRMHAPLHAWLVKSAFHLLGAVLLCQSLQAGEIEVDGRNLTFQSPEGFRDFTPEMISAKFPNSRAPQHVIGNASGTTCIAYEITQNAITPDQLPQAREALTQTFDRVVPGIQWVENKIIEKDGTKWIYLEMTSRAVDQDIHNMMLATSYKGRFLVFNFNSTKKEFPDYEAALRSSIDSIRMDE